MNRAARRRAAADARRACHRPGYVHRLLGMSDLLAEKYRGKVVHAAIEHDRWCEIYRGRACNCVPDISIPDGAGTVWVVEAEAGSRR